VVKYVCRHRSKNGRQDIEKAIHYLQLLLEWEYAAPLPGSARYEEIHAELTEGEVAEIAQPRCIYGGVTECKRDCPGCKFGGDSGMM